MRPFFPKEGACAREKSRTHALLSFYQAIGLTAYLANVSFVLQELEEYYWVDYVKVTKDNASQYVK